jgi:hypothetical protein
MTFGDNDKAIFGAGSDLQIYSDGDSSYLKENSATGSLFIDGDNIRFRTSDGSKSYALFTNSGSARLYHDNSIKIETTATGIDVSGTVTADGLTVSAATGSSSITPTDIIIKTETSASDWSTTDEWGRVVFYSDDISNGGAKAHATIGASPTASGGGLSNLVFKTSNSTPSLVKRMDINEIGDISFYEDTGTTPKFFWDASEESLNIGTTSGTADRRLHITGLGPSTATSQFGIVANPSFPTSATANVYNLYTGPNLTSGTTLTNLYNLYLESNNKTGSTVTNSYGLYQAGSGDKNYFAGNVGIGTSSPDTLMELRAANPVLTIRDTETSTASNDARLRLAETGVSDALGNYYDIGYIQGNLQFRYNTSEYMRLDDSGNLLVGGTTVADLGTVNELISLRAGHYLQIAQTGTGTNSLAYFYNGNGLVGTISTSGSATAYNTSSDARLKENIADAEDASSLVDAIKVRQFDWKADGSHQRYGMVAQELLEVAPEAVSGDPESDDMMGVDYSKLVPMLVKEIQSLRARVAQLEGV